MAETAAQKKARLAAAAKEAAYIKSLENPITSQYDPRIAENAGLNLEMDAAQMTSSGQTPEEAAKVAAEKTRIAGLPKAGKFLKYKPGSKPGFQIPVFADGKGGEFDGEEIAIAVSNPLTTATTLKTAEQIAADEAKAKAQGERQSAYDLLYSQFAQYGLSSLVEPLKGLITSGASPAEFTIKLRESEPYKKRFSANAQRISKGLKAINEAEYLGLEDQYQNILRNAGLPESYWKRGDLGMQEGFTNFIANDVSAVELEDRVSTAQKRLMYANPEVSIALKTFYPDITNGDLLAYALDPTKGLEQIKRRITAAEVGSTAVQMGLATNVTDAEYLARYGVTKQTAQQGYQTIAGGLQRGSQLASIYGENPYTQTTAEQEVFGVPGAAEAKAARQKITGLEKATFGGQSGVSSSALARDRAGNF